MTYIFYFLLLPINGLAAAPYVPCECPVATCPPCQRSEGVNFITEKCGKNNEQRRSCASVKCVADTASKDPQCAKKSDNGKATDSARQPSSISSVKNSGIGSVKIISGNVQIIRADGSVRSMQKDDVIQEHDAIASDASGSALIEFHGGNRLNIMPNTKMTIQEYQRSEEKRKAILGLLKGKIRNEIREKYADPQASYYKVKTPAVVAGVRGTDFVVSYDEQEASAVSKVETFEGMVQLNERIGDKHVMVDGGKAVVYTSTRPAGTIPEWSDVAQKGKFANIYEMTTAQLAALDASTQLDKNRLFAKKSTASAKKEPAICKSPGGRLNQCAWKCVNNPKGAKTCRTDMPSVSCVRTRCNANGEWSEETRLPASAGQECLSEGYSIESCDY